MRKISKEDREIQVKTRSKELGHEFIGWLDGHENKDSKLIIKCHKHGTWNPMLSNYIRKGQCMKCVIESKRLSSPDKVISSKLPEHIKFIKFVDVYKNQRSRVVVRCSIHGEQNKSVTDIVNKNSFCKECGIEVGVSQKRLGEESAIKKIMEKCNEHGYKFKGYKSKYKSYHSRFNVECPIHGEWNTSLGNFLKSRVGCQECGKHGYRKSIRGYLYHLISECGGYMKIGITNNHKVRVKELSYCTPFAFNVVEIISGEGSCIANLEKDIHSKLKPVGMSGFNGCTEWFYFDSSVKLPKLP